MLMIMIHDDDDLDDDDHDADYDDADDDSQAGCDEPPRAVGPETSAEASKRNRNLPGVFKIQPLTYLVNLKRTGPTKNY